MGIIVKTPVLGAFNPVRHKPAFAFTQTSRRIEIYTIETIGIVNKKGADKYVQLFNTFVLRMSGFSYDVAQISLISKIILQKDSELPQFTLSCINHICY